MEPENLCLATTRPWLILQGLKGGTISIALQSGVRLDFRSFGILFAWTKPTSEIKGGRELSLCDCLETMKFSEATDDRDRIFALFGIATELTPDILLVDYSLSADT